MNQNKTLTSNTIATVSHELHRHEQTMRKLHVDLMMILDEIVDEIEEIERFKEGM